MSIERVVTVLTPVFAALAGLVSTVVSQAIPGVSLNKTDLTAVFIAGATLAAGAALKWLHGRQKFVAFETDTDKVVAKVKAAVQADPLAGPALADIEKLVKAHTDQIIQAVGQAVHAPASVDQVVEAVAQKLTAVPPPPPAV